MNVWRRQTVSMRTGTRIWLVLFLVCLGISAWEIPNIRRVWRENLSARRLGNTSTKALAQPPCTEIRNRDPEAFALIEVLAGDPNTQDWATLLLRYPQNELVLARLIDSLSGERAVPPQTLLTLANHLLACDPENAHYHYLRANVLWAFHTPQTAERALNEVDKGNEATIWIRPYDKYRSRIDAILDEMRVSTLRRIRLEGPLDRFYGRLYSSLFQMGRAETKVRPRLAALGTGVAGQILTHGRDPRILYWASLFLNLQRQSLGEAGTTPRTRREARLQLARAMALEDIDRRTNEEQLRTAVKLYASAMVLGAAVLLLVHFVIMVAAVWLIGLLRGRARGARGFVSDTLLFAVAFVGYFLLLLALLRPQDSKNPFAYTISLAEQPKTPPTWVYLSLGGMPLVLWLGLFLLTRARPRRWSQLGRFVRITALAFVVVWLMLVFYLAFDLSGLTDDGPDLNAGFFALILCVDLLLFLGWVLLACPWAVMKVVPARQLIQNRIAQLCVLIPVMASLTILAHTYYPRLQPGSFLLFLVLTGLVITHHTPDNRSKFADVLRSAFRKGGPIFETRTRMLRLFAACVLLCWSVALVSLYLTAEHLGLVAGQPATQPASQPLPTASPATVQMVLSGTACPTDDSTSSDRQMLSNLYLVEPNELPRFLVPLKRQPEPVSDSQILLAMRRSGPDAMPIFLQFLDAPDANDVLVCRALLGDTSVREPVEYLFHKYLERIRAQAPEGQAEAGPPENRQLRRGFYRLSKLTEALQPISTPEECLEHVTRIIDAVPFEPVRPLNLSAESWEQESVEVSERELFRIIDDMPGRTGTAALRYYLEKTDYQALDAPESAYELLGTLARHCDGQLAERVLVAATEKEIVTAPPNWGNLSLPFYASPKERVFLSQPVQVNSHLLGTVCPYFTASSIPLLVERLEHPDPEIRALLVCQLTRLGYTWRRADLYALRHDPDWRVRLAILHAAGARDWPEVRDDKHAVVRAVAHILQNTT